MAPCTHADDRYIPATTVVGLGRALDPFFRSRTLRRDRGAKSLEIHRMHAEEGGTDDRTEGRHR